MGGAATVCDHRRRADAAFGLPAGARIELRARSRTRLPERIARARQDRQGIEGAPAHCECAHHLSAPGCWRRADAALTERAEYSDGGLMDESYVPPQIFK